MENNFTEKEIQGMRKLLGLRDDQMLIVFADHAHGVAGVMRGDPCKMHATLSRVMPEIEKHATVTSIMKLVSKLAGMR